MTDPTPAVPPAAPAPETQPSPPVGTRRVLDVALEKLRLAFQRAQLATGGQPILWDAFLAPAPNPMQPGHILTGIAIFISIPSSLLGENLTMTPMIDISFVELSQEKVDEWVRDRVNELLAARRQQAVELSAQQNGQQEAPASSGRLFVPGQG